ncbi:MAG: endolytic transglycosylase MltG [Prevotellaceae bacterium]|jgi:UPF0755 protein|nr:endolytic transglycosylase MltG [Prevotellaceae bacterium]
MKKITIRIILILLVLTLIPAGYFGLKYYSSLFKSNVSISGDGTYYLYIPTGSSFENLMDSLKSSDALISEDAFLAAAKLKKFSAVRPGRYKLQNGMTNRILINMLAAGNQAPVRLTLAGNIRTKEKLAEIVSRYIEPDSTLLLECFNDNKFLEEFGVNSNTMLSICILNTYEFYWNTSPDDFVSRMYKEFERFWTDERKAKLAQTSLSQMDAITLASIVAEETIKTDEMPKVAGVYLNRLNKGMLLQADPTVKYAVGDFTLRRVLNRHTEYDSPYNTYKYAGLPPGPICIPSIAAIDAVLNAEKHDYYYFCAKADFSGYHAFAKTLAQHNQNAKAYQQALNKERIYR